MVFGDISEDFVDEAPSQGMPMENARRESFSLAMFRLARLIVRRAHKESAINLALVLNRI